MTFAHALSAPPLDADNVLLVDWLEILCFFDPRGVARLDEIDNVIAIQAEEGLYDDARADALKDELRELIENEVDIRSESLKDAYPFELSEDGEELRIKPRTHRRGMSFYLTCLIVSHFSKSPILLTPPDDNEEAVMRKRHFQTFSTIAVAGYVEGPAVSFGWPRQTGETITEAVSRCCDSSQTGTARIPPGPVAAARAKDGGMDVIAWRVAVNGGPPPSYMCFGQAASGHLWAGKSSKDELESFLEGYFLDRPACNYTTVTVIPFRLTEEAHAQFGHRHGSILDRLRAPRAALIAMELAQDGLEFDELTNAYKLGIWLARYRGIIREAA
ncbi:hypothetical protein [Qipengyuania soli]|uniref:Uncharacterized protein n=1 Tax=Qipengyuania soli TaxID=2782568 RepID=A0A7S8F6V4_9SPHN|nr:hypothetical protein [Qipengyuania soli]QPD00212.1 hypothetical protein IRL76_06720 [Qipengyuania soli]